MQPFRAHPSWLSFNHLEHLTTLVDAGAIASLAPICPFTKEATMPSLTIDSTLHVLTCNDRRRRHRVICAHLVLLQHGLQ